MHAYSTSKKKKKFIKINFFLITTNLQTNDSQKKNIYYKLTQLIKHLVKEKLIKKIGNIKIKK